MPSGAVSRSVAAAGAVIILVLHLAAIRVQLYRALLHDEAEHLHAAWLLTEGKQLYRDFNENHSPFLYALLKPIVRVPDPRQMMAWGRFLAALAGLVAAGAAAFLAWRAASDPAAPVVALACILGAGATWGRAVADIRSEPLTLALFWVGAVLVLMPRRRGR